MNSKIFSKKNSGNFGWVRGKPTYFGNPKYNEAKDGIVEEIRSQHKGPPIPGALNMWVLCWGNNELWYKSLQKGEVPDCYAGWDIDNKVTSVFDLLTAARVIHDDCQLQEMHCKKMHGKCHGTYGALLVLTSHCFEDKWHGVIKRLHKEML